MSVHLVAACVATTATLWGLQDSAVELDRLIEQLGSDEQPVREKAMGELAGRQETAVEVVTRAAESKDPEISTRARAILECWRWKVPPELARVQPWLGARLSSGDFAQQIEAVETLLSCGSHEVSASLGRLAVDRQADARVRRAAAFGVALLGVESPQPARSAVEPLSAQQIAALRRSPDLPLIQKAAAVFERGDRPARLEAFGILNEVTGAELFTQAEDPARIPPELEDLVEQEGLYRWKCWWAQNAARWAAEAPAPAAPTPLTSTEILVTAMLGDPGEVSRDAEGRVIQKTVAQSEIFTYDGRGALKEKRTDPSRIFKYAYLGSKTFELTSRFDAVGNRFDYTYDESGVLVLVAGPADWRLELCDGRAARLLRGGQVVLQFPR